MTRAELLKSPDYWKTRIQIGLYRCAAAFMGETHRNRKELAEYLGVSNGYVSQLLNGDYDHKLSKLAELSLAFGYVPNIEFVPVEEYMADERSKIKFKRYARNTEYHFSDAHFRDTVRVKSAVGGWTLTNNQKEVA